MEFVVIMRALDSANVPPSAAIAMAKQTFQMVAANQDPRIKKVYLFAGERAGVLIVDAKSGDELQDVLGSMPLAGISKAEIHPVGSVESTLKTLEAAEKRVAAMMPAGVR
jgi:muconolactone delta-isomerase